MNGRAGGRAPGEPDLAARLLFGTGCVLIVGVLLFVPPSCLAYVAGDGSRRSPGTGARGRPSGEPAGATGAPAGDRAAGGGGQHSPVQVTSPPGRAGGRAAGHGIPVP